MCDSQNIIGDTTQTKQRPVNTYVDNFDYMTGALVINPGTGSTNLLREYVDLESFTKSYRKCLYRFYHLLSPT